MKITGIVQRMLIGLISGKHIIQLRGNTTMQVRGVMERRASDFLGFMPIESSGRNLLMNLERD